MKRLAKNLRVQHFEKGDYIFKEGDSGRHAYYILRGRVLFLKNKQVELDQPKLEE